MNRRRFMTLLMHAGGVLMTMVLAIPGAITLISPTLLTRRSALWTQVGAIDGFPPDSTKAALIEVPRDDWSRSMRTQLLYIRRTEAGDVEALSRKCTDLSCPVTWDSGSETFLCPCHGGIFNRDGQPIAGPPSRPLYRYEHRIREGILEVNVNSIPPFG